MCLNMFSYTMRILLYSMSITMSNILQDSTSSGAVSKPALNPRDRLKKKMQILLNKQCIFTILLLSTELSDIKGLYHSLILIVKFADKADKMAEIEKNERQIQQQQERDDEMREMALRLRRR